MAAKEFKFASDARDRMLRGVEPFIVADAMLGLSLLSYIAATDIVPLRNGLRRGR